MEIREKSHYQLRTTGEPVFVIGPTPTDTLTYSCIRPVQGRDGITHQLYTAYPEELESHEEGVRREMESILLRERLAQELQRSIDIPTGKPQLVKPN